MAKNKATIETMKDSVSGEAALPAQNGNAAGVKDSLENAPKEQTVETVPPIETVKDSANTEAKYKIHSRGAINQKRFGLRGQIVCFDGNGIATVSKEQFDFFISVPGYEAAK